MSFERFARRMAIRARNVPREVNKVVRTVALAADQALVLGTPVDTGRARSNWIVSLGGEAGGEQGRNAKGQFTGKEIEPYAPIPSGTNPDKFGESANARAAISQGEAEIAKYTGGAIFITNNVPYIKPLNEGSSSQAPAMFVEAAVQTAVNAVAGARIDTGR